MPYTILELDAGVVKTAQAKGEKINYGDATRTSLSDGNRRSTRACFGHVRPPGRKTRRKSGKDDQQEYYIIVRTRYTPEIPELLKLGANEVIPEEFETSIEIFARVLHIYGVADRLSTNRSMKSVKKVMRCCVPITYRLNPN